MDFKIITALPSALLAEKPEGEGPWPAEITFCDKPWYLTAQMSNNQACYLKKPYNE